MAQPNRLDQIGSLLLVALLALALAPGTLKAQVRSPDRVMDQSRWISTELRDHPLTGTIWDVGGVRHISSNALTAVTRTKDLLLIGETHDNADHHQLQSWLIHQSMRGRTAIVMEMFGADEQPLLDRFIAELPWHRLPSWQEKNGRFRWSDLAIYEPIFKVAAAAQLPIMAGDPPRDTIRKIAREGLAALPNNEQIRLGLDRALDAKLNDALIDELDASHCGLVPKAHFTNMAAAQRYRDARLAHAMSTAQREHRHAILLAGNGHVRKDRGVPLYLAGHSPVTVPLTVLLIEVEDGKTDPAAYVPRDPDGKPAADYIVFTPRVERKDPCIAMREQMKPRQ